MNKYFCTIRLGCHFFPFSRPYTDKPRHTRFLAFAFVPFRKNDYGRHDSADHDDADDDDPHGCDVHVDPVVLNLAVVGNDAVPVFLGSSVGCILLNAVNARADRTDCVMIRKNSVCIVKLRRRGAQRHHAHKQQEHK